MASSVLNIEDPTVNKTEKVSALRYLIPALQSNEGFRYIRYYTDHLSAMMWRSSECYIGEGDPFNLLSKILKRMCY